MKGLVLKVICTPLTNRFKYARTIVYVSTNADIMGSQSALVMFPWSKNRKMELYGDEDKYD